MPAGAAIAEIGDDDHPREEGEEFEIPAPPQGGQQDGGEELDQHRRRQQRAAQRAAPVQGSQHGQADERDGEAVDMRAAGELPDRQRVPGIDQHPLAGEIADPQQAQDGDDGHAVAQRDGDLHRRRPSG